MFKILLSYTKKELLNPNLEKIYIIKDNERYYNNILVKEYLLNSRIVEMPLPRYSPNINLIEVVVIFQKKSHLQQILWKFSAFKKAVMDFFDRDILSAKISSNLLLLKITWKLFDIKLRKTNLEWQYFILTNRWRISRFILKLYW